MALSSVLRRASSCSCFSLACRRARSSSALFLSSSSFCLAMFSKRALMLPVLLPAGEQKIKEKRGDEFTRCLKLQLKHKPTLLNAHQPPQVWFSGKMSSASPHRQKSLHSVNQRDEDVTLFHTHKTQKHTHKHSLPCPCGHSGLQISLQILLNNLATTRKEKGHFLFYINDSTTVGVIRTCFPELNKRNYYDTL